MLVRIMSFIVVLVAIIIGCDVASNSEAHSNNLMVVLLLVLIVFMLTIIALTLSRILKHLRDHTYSPASE